MKLDALHPKTLVSTYDRATIAAIITAPPDPPDNQGGGAWRRSPQTDRNYCPETWETVVNWYLHGYTKVQRDYEKNAKGILDRLNTLIPLESPQAYEYREVGDEVDVAEYLAGEPACMIAHNAEIATKHYRIVASIGFNASWELDQIRNRGAAIAALVEYLAADQHNNVELTLYFHDRFHGSDPKPDPRGRGIEYSFVMMNFPTRPLDRDLLRLCLTEPCFFRRIGADIDSHASGYGYTGSSSERPPNSGLFEAGEIHFPCGDDQRKYKTPQSTLETLSEIVASQINGTKEGAHE